MAPKNHKCESRNWNGLTLRLYAMPFGDHNIWARLRPYFGTCANGYTEADKTNVHYGSLADILGAFSNDRFGGNADIEI
jgi:hypothetical protein